MKIYPTISLKDLVAASRDTTISISSTPFGVPLGQKQVYVKKAVPWKGVKGAAFFEVAKAYGALGDAVRSIRDFSKKFAGLKGSVEVSIPVVGSKVMPLKSAMQMVAVGKVDRKQISAPFRMRLPAAVSHTALAGIGPK